ncbi:D-glutamate cyclase, mitochondrial-like isoform X2 [Acanthaster planci]|uniref:D-glutamate cyclase, mitochondrial-like isoform X2 n=1 Tax=Acanthaster planci TaxID=133434 RepID=A0A8B7Y0D5_ACAPL|nr:D-glutamate cyclase, mitochondrial-like isoform X2 [Acanthaster planci]
MPVTIGTWGICICSDCLGHVQTNLLGLHKSLAEDFTKFCAFNSGPLPLLYQSDVGQFTAPGLTQTDSDIRTDLPAYNVMENGEFTHTVENLLDFQEALKDFIFFYSGCSFSFDQALQAAGVPLRNQEQNCAVSQYKTSVKCHPIGLFKCNMVVSLRPIPRDLVETAVRVTHPLINYHGAPVHIGDPAFIGITNIDRPEYCGPMKFHDDDIPVFWACGTTVIEAIKTVKPSLAFTHHENDSVYISDTPVQGQDDSPADIKVITLCEKPFWASVTSEAVMRKIKQLEGLIAENLGNRQIDNLVVPDDLLKSVLALSHASSVAVTTGFPCFLNNKNPYGNDGPPGAIAIAMMLQILGKEVDLVVDNALYGPLTMVLEAMVEKNVLVRPISVVQFPPEGEEDSLETAKKFLLNDGSNTPRYDHLLAIERSGKAEDGGYYTMKAIDVGRLVGGIDWLFLAAADLPKVHTSGIGDGGNELRMGKVRDMVHLDIPQGPTITCSVASDFLLTAGVSNWGGYAVAVGLYLVSVCPIHERYKRRAVGFPPSDEDRQRFRSELPSVDREREMLGILISHEFFDMTGTDVLHVDGLSFEDVHAKKIEQLLSVITEE